jgi:glycosyltransferase involved in cell wall biosynthesis
LRIYGHGPLLDELQRQIRSLGMDGRIWLEGPTEDTARVLESLDVFVFSSLQEGLPLVILEAMAAGLPIVSTRVGGVPEAAPEGLVARYCEPGNADALADAMLRSTQDTRLAEMGRAGRELAAEQYGILRMSDHYSALYRRLLAR